MARRVLSSRHGCSLWLLFALSLSSCRHEDRAPAPSSSVSAAGHDFSVQARDRHFEEELTRARARWQAEPGLGDCTNALKEKADLELCQAAAGALAVISKEGAATPELAIERLEPGALTLVRLSERMRYLALAELTQRNVEADAGVAPTTVPHARREQGSARPEPHALELRRGPVSQLMEATIRTERDVIRNLGAYLEYGPLPVRRRALDSVKRLRAQHPKWPLLDHLLQEASVLESDADLKRDLRQLLAQGRP